MVRDLLKEITQYEGSGEDIRLVIDELGLYDVFKPLFESVKFANDVSLQTSTVFFIVHLYSRNSKPHVLGASWGQVKRAMAKRLKITDKTIIKVEDKDVLATIFNYLRFQNYRLLLHIITLKEQYEKMLLASIEEVEHKQRFECGTYADKLYERIATFEKILRDEESSTAEKIEEVETNIGKKLDDGLSPDILVE